MAKLDYLRSLDMQERLNHFKAKGIKGSYRGDPKPTPRGGAVVFSRQFDGTEFMGHHPSENTDLTEGDIAQQRVRARLRDDFLTTVQKEALFDPSDEFLSSAWDDDNLCAETSEADPDAMETTFYSEDAEPIVPLEAVGGASNAMDVDGADQGQAEDSDNAGGANKEDSSQHEEIWPPTGVEWTAKLKYMTGFRQNHTSTR
ncbi:hypothetical protein CSHISOI_07448 [Colletotrichum shisoi]|uniref:Uncharacterized protein n=1 Tax=Colletotrichum shisoi TaxID=2078593 RepID=A0A5Q4BMR2_9PEZI|nr:hypothetical protein CSHISOI_07448 [Colletotrichum shisoi]